MAMRPLDFRSDTVTRPTPDMRRAMAAAEVGDDVYGEDPTVRRLEEHVAGRLGHEAALFVPSGTMANQIAIGLHCRPGDEVLAEAGSHVLHYESGALAALWGAQPHALAGQGGLLEPAQVTQAARPEAVYAPRTRLLVLENTHNRAGGRLWPLARYLPVVEAARRARLGVHLDGARLFNAEVAAGVPAREWAALADTVSVCFSKGLGAPVGSALAASAERVAEARRLRKRLGGGMRQAGVLAAAALWALEHHLERLAEDHENARRLAQGLAGVAALQVDPAQVQTNMVVVEFSVPAEAAVARLREVGVLTNPAGGSPGAVRWVCHLDVSRADVDEALARVRGVFAG